MPEKKRMKLRKKTRLSFLHRGIDPFYVLALSQKKVRFFRCDRDVIEPLELDAKTPRSLADTLRFLVLEKTHQHYGQPSGANPRGAARMRVAGAEEKKMRVEEFIEDVADGVDRALRGQRRRWLILAMVEYEAAMFRNASEHPRIAGEIIHGNPGMTTARELHRQALEIARGLTRREHFAGMGDAALASQHYQAASRSSPG